MGMAVPCCCFGMIQFELCWQVDWMNSVRRQMDLGGWELEFVKKVVEVAQVETSVGGIEEREAAGCAGLVPHSLADLRVIGWAGRAYELSVEHNVPQVEGSGSAVPVAEVGGRCNMSLLDSEHNDLVEAH